MANQIINTFGLILNIAGVILLAFYGVPQPTFEEGIGLGLEDNTPYDNKRTVAEYNADIRRLKRQFAKKSRFALGLIVIGFILQLCATWV